MSQLKERLAAWVILLSFGRVASTYESSVDRISPHQMERGPVSGTPSDEQRFWSTE